MPTLQGVYADLVGQEHVVEILEKAVLATRTGEETQEMTHAWVFTGPPGSGRSSAAIAFAQALVCANNGCGTCNECKSAANGAHPDVEIIRTEGLSIKVEEVRELLANSNRIKEENRERIFERFYQVDNPDMNISDGGGGLSIVRDFVTLHDGTVNVMIILLSVVFLLSISR